MNSITERLKFADFYPTEAGKLAQKLHIKKDEIPLIRKYYAYDKSEGDVSKKDRTLISRISCVDKDRDNEVLLPSGVKLDNYKKNPIVCWGHSYNDPKNFVGKNLWIKQDDRGLIAKTAFVKNEFADQVFRAYTEDVAGTGPLLKGFSVGFIPLEFEEPETKGKDGEDAPERIYTSWELLEYSCVGIPSSPESLTLAVKKGIVTLDRLRKDIEKNIVVEDIEIDDPEVTIDDSVSVDASISAYAETVITKPETIGQYHHIPVNPGCKITATITISVAKGIKATYCGEVKKIHTYLFDVKKWTMAEAQAWVKENHKILKRHEEILSNRIDEGIKALDVDIEIIKQTIEQVDKEVFGMNKTIVNIDDIFQEIPDEELEEEKATVEIDGLMQEIPLPTEEEKEEVELSVEDEEKQEKYECEHDWISITTKDKKPERAWRCSKCGDEYYSDTGEFPPDVKEASKDFDEAKHEPDDHADLKEAIGIIFEDIQEQLSELKEGRVLSAKNRTLVKETIDMLSELREKLDQLYNATEPPQRQEEEREVTIETDVHKETDVHNLENHSNIVQEAVKEALNPEKIKQILNQSVADEIDRIRGRVR